MGGETVVSWKERERLPEIFSSYAPQDNWKLDESGLFWRASPEKGWVCYHIPCISFNAFFLSCRPLGQEAKDCAGGKMSKHFIRILFIVNATGGSESKPIVIAKSRNPRSFSMLTRASYMYKSSIIINPNYE